jgi:hypothetical protein
MTISPPAKVNAAKVKPACFDQIAVLAHGIDSLDLAIDVVWGDEQFFIYLEAIKSVAVKKGNPLTVFLDRSDPLNESPFRIFNHGTQGYRWLLSNAQFSLKIGNWPSPKKKGRPSILASIRSETLWTLGLSGAMDLLLELITEAGATVVSVKTSRVDLCVDLLLPEQYWHKNLPEYRVCRARKLSDHFENDSLTGITIGSGKVLARLYDKPMEIKLKSPHKVWFYHIWGIEPDDIPAGHRIIRVEYQLRRTALKELGVDTFSDLCKKTPNLWAYCTRKWLKFRNRPGNHHTMRKTFEWWKSVQNGFDGAQAASPLIRVKAFNAQTDQFFAQAKGQLTSLYALQSELNERRLDKPTSIDDVLQYFANELLMSGITDDDISEEVLHKRAKYHRFLYKQHNLSIERRLKDHAASSH